MRYRHMTVGALIAIMWDESMRGKTQQVGDYSQDPLICGLTWNQGGTATQTIHIKKDGSLDIDKYFSIKITCPKCIEVLKMNGL